MKILIIEDNDRYSYQLNLKLKYSGFDTQVENTCESGLSYFEDNQHNVDAILLDVNFKKKGEGLILLKKIKNISNVWVGIMSQEFTHDESADSLGCDAFFSKTVTDINRLTINLQALVECKAIPRSNSKCKFYLINNQFYLNDTLFSLDGIEFEILKYLYDRVDKVNPVTKYNISKECAVSNDSVAVHVSHIRDKLPTICSRIIIKTHFGRGYSCPFGPSEEKKRK